MFLLRTNSFKIKMGLASAVGIILIAYVIQESRGNELAPLAYSVRVVLPEPVWTCKSPGWSCRDCGTLQSCNANSEPEFSVKCADQFPTRPFCDPVEGKCTSDKNKCQEIETGYICPNRGIYPDLTDCRKYVSCAAKNQIGVSYNCLYASVYDHNKTRCITGAKCYTTAVDCAGKSKAIAYPPDNSLYVICRGSEEPMLKDCGSKSFSYNPNTMECEFQCKEEGNFPHPFISKNFYVCVRNGTVLVHEEKVCRENTIFDESVGYCVLNTPQTPPDQGSSTSKSSPNE